MVMGALIVLAGCAAGASSGPPNYRAGYAAGCRSGHADASGEDRAVRYDAKTFGADPAHRDDWSHGYLECLIQTRRAGRSTLFDIPFFPMR